MQFERVVVMLCYNGILWSFFLIENTNNECVCFVLFFIQLIKELIILRAQWMRLSVKQINRKKSFTLLIGQ